MDLAACLIGFSYGYAHGYHLTTYMEAGTYCNPSFYYNIPSDTL